MSTNSWISYLVNWNKLEIPVSVTRKQIQIYDDVTVFKFTCRSHHFRYSANFVTHFNKLQIDSLSRRPTPVSTFRRSFCRTLFCLSWSLKEDGSTMAEGSGKWCRPILYRPASANTTSWEGQLFAGWRDSSKSVGGKNTLIWDRKKAKHFSKKEETESFHELCSLVKLSLRILHLWQGTGRRKFNTPQWFKWLDKNWERDVVCVIITITIDRSHNMHLANINVSWFLAIVQPTNIYLQCKQIKK